MSDSHQARTAADAATDTDDPEILALLDFEPVPRRFKTGEGWTAPLQRKFIAQLARTGSPGKACDALGKRRSGIDKLYKAVGADSFREAWAKAVEIAERRAAERIEAEHAAVRDLKPPFLDNRRKPAAAPANDRWEDEEEEDDEENQAFKLDVLGVIIDKYLAKVAAERRARLAGEVVAADFAVRQITALEVAIDLMSEGLGMTGFEALQNSRRAGHSLFDIVETPFSRALDQERRRVWGLAGEPERPEHPDPRYAIDHGQGPWGPREHGFSLAADQNATGAGTTPARGFSQEEWARMRHDEQKHARERQFAEDAAAQVAWESRAKEAWETSQAQRSKDLGDEG